MSCLTTMSQKELHRLELIQRIRGRSLSVVEAAELLRLSRSQVHRLLQAYDLAAPTVSSRRSAAVRATGVTARISATWCSTWCVSITGISDQRWPPRS
ncbi:hypothetical protein J2Z31_005173 [Sinorhizobium kostiense]|uniref:Helix-turn-helix domain-containing protein n=1 Tax=Sinorhizobium kostiense TaxID=76747 RepID=A0ABS4R6W1_9HYPH|nr:hypothetical protein [Sinorhizobium kostiense]